MLTLRGVDADDAWCARLRAKVAADLLDIGLPGLTINVRDAEVRESLMTLTTMDPPVVALVSMWTQQSYGAQVQAATALLQQECDDVAAYLVTESVPLPPPLTVPGQRTTRTGQRRAAAQARRPRRVDVAVALAHRPHTGGDRDPVDVRLYTERSRARPDPRRAGHSRRSWRNFFPPRRSPICMRSSEQPMTTICATEWSG